MFDYFNVPYHDDVYFTKAMEASIAEGTNSEVLYQVFQKKEGIFAGGNFVQKMFRRYAEQCDVPLQLDILPDGSKLVPGEPVMHLRGLFRDIVEFETTYLGTMAHCTRIATNVDKVVKVANGKPVLFFPARFSLPETQIYDGYAAAVGGATACSTKNQAYGFNKYKNTNVDAVGTMSHAMIANFGGDTVKAALAVAKARPNDQQHVLVDFHNNCVKTAIEVFKAFKENGLKLDGIRLDTSERLIDYGLQTSISALPQTLEEQYYFYGVCPELVKYVRRELNAIGAHDVKITVSGGFNAAKVKSFEDKNVPVDVYAVGESFLEGSYPFTSDIVTIFNEDGSSTPIAKVGRGFKPSDRLVRVVDTKGVLQSV
jgi:nicotinate phosphoribosyltransferase